MQDSNPAESASHGGFNIIIDLNSITFTAVLFLTVIVSMLNSEAV
jgi:hypothetical protein